jgi:hypothetical protein
VRHLRLRAGTHSVKVKNVTLGLERSLLPVVKADRETADAETFAKGNIDVETTPGTEVWLDGARQGTTPLAPVSVWEGRHSVVLGRGNAQRRFPLDVLPGSTTHVRDPRGSQGGAR